MYHFAETRDKNATYRNTTTTSEFMYLMDKILDDEVKLGFVAVLASMVRIPF